MIFADTGYFLALTDQHDQHHAQAQAWSTACRERLVVSEYVLVETLNALSGTRYRIAAHDIVDAVRTNPQFLFIEANSDLFNSGLAFHRQHADKSWSFTDCTSFLIMREHKITRALAFDHHFVQAGFEPLLRRDPP